MPISVLVKAPQIIAVKDHMELGGVVWRTVFCYLRARAAYLQRWTSKMARIYALLAIVAVAIGLTACSYKNHPGNEVYTLYSTNFPHDSGRHPIATFDVAATPELSLSICQEAAELYQADFENKKRENGQSQIWVNAKVRHWCEKGRYRK